MVDIFSEIDEELRRDRLAQFAQRYSGLLVAGAVAIVLVTVGIVGWRWWTERQHRAETQILTQAIDQADRGDSEAALAGLAKLEDKGSGVALLARLRAAALLADKGSTKQAVAIYDAIAADDGVASAYRDLATIRSALLQADQMDPKALIQRLQPLDNDTNPFRHSARELIATADLRAGNKDQARDVFKRLAQDPTAPAGIRRRSQEMLAILEGKVG